MEIAEGRLRHTAGEGDGWVNWTGLATLVATVEESVKNHLSGIVSLF